MVSFVEFQVFDSVSGELRPWISWLEEFFVRENFTADEKMNLAQSLLEGEAWSWFYRRQKTVIFESWEQLKDSLLLRFGEFSDSDRIRLIVKHNRLLKEMRDEAIQWMKTTSLPETDTIPVTKLTEEANSDPVMAGGEAIDFIQDIESSSAYESKKEVESQVHVSDFENLRNIETMAVSSVLDNFETVVMKAKIQQNIRIDVVNGDVERIHRVMSITKTVSAHQVLDKLCQLKGLETKKKMKVLKSWMFKYKSKRRRSRKRHNQDWFNTLSRRESWKKHKHENLQIASGLLGFNVVSFRCHKEYGLARMNNWGQVRAEYSLMQGKLFTRNDFTSDGILDGDIAKFLNSIGDKLQFLCEKVPIVSCLSLDAQFKSLEVVMVVLKVHHSLRNTRFLFREMKQFVGFMMFQLKHKWRSKHLHTISAWECYLSSVFSTVTSADSCSGYMRMHEQLPVHTLLIVNDVKSQVKHKWRLVWRLWRLHNQWFVLVILQLPEPYGWSGARGLGQLLLDDLKSHMRHKWKSKHLRAVFGPQNNPSYALDVVTTAAIFQRVPERFVSHDCFLGSLWEKKIASLLEVICVWADCKMHTATVISAKLPQTIRGSELVTDSGRLQAVLEQTVHILPAAEHKSSALWHRWRRKASICVLPLQFSFFKLEDKLILEGGCIDTIHELMTWLKFWLKGKTRVGKEALPLGSNKYQELSSFLGYANYDCEFSMLRFLSQ